MIFARFFFVICGWSLITAALLSVQRHVVLSPADLAVSGAVHMLIGGGAWAFCKRRQAA